MLEINKVYNDDCLNVMKKLDDNSVDLVVTDPPYQLSDTKHFKNREDNLDYADTEKSEIYGNKANPFCGKTVKGFMGKEWDVLPSQEIWNEMFRVLKHGAFAFILMTPRQDSSWRILSMLERAGFQISFTSMFWCYAQGFSKASNISKMVDKRLGVERDKLKGNVGYVNGVNHKGGDYTGEYSCNNPVTLQAKKLDGSFAGFQPKPALELILVAMKPLSEKTYVEQALKDGKGITWLDDCRMPYINEKDFEQRQRGVVFDGKDQPETVYNKSFGLKSYDSSLYENRKGRFPANILVSDNVLDDDKKHESSWRSSGKRFGKGTIRNVNFKAERYFGDNPFGFPDSGSFSRYFDLDMWWKERVKLLPKNVRETFPFFIVPKTSTGERNDGLDEGGNVGGNTYNRKCNKCGKWERQAGEGWSENPEERTCFCEIPEWNIPVGNIHPTCKPVKLLSYLITLGSRENDLVLDPFLGSGSTVIACKMLNRKYIGVEKDESYFDIAEQKIQNTGTQPSLFSFVKEKVI